tara:strand:- start:410 stop:646 length:237 start_codon:yes stop_codon:yes gene_type:complete
MLRLTENQIRQLIRQVLKEVTDPEKIDRLGGGMKNHPGQNLAPGEQLGTGGDWWEEDMGIADYGDEPDSLDEMEEEEE